MFSVGRGIEKVFASAGSMDESVTYINGGFFAIKKFVLKDFLKDFGNFYMKTMEYLYKNDLPCLSKSRIF
jgi:hypothetical protein